MRRGGLLIVAIAACGGPPPPAPSAVISASPTSVCVGDAYTTTIHLDGKQSSPRLTLVYEKPDPSEPPLRMKWSFSGSAVEIDTGDDVSDELTLRMAADRPLHVRLRVENAEGGVTEALTTISVTPLDENGQCPLPVGP